MRESHQSYRNCKHFAGLNGVRAIAIIAVIWHHSAHPAFLPIFARGFFGVDLFFVLSGFLISTLLIREKARNKRISLKNFWVRRILRLVPAYYLLLFGLLAAYLVLKPGDPDTQRLISGFPVYALYLSNWIQPGATNLSITWSLATEEQFYLVWPLAEAFLTPAATFVAWLSAVIINQLINFGVLDPAIYTAFGVSADQHPEILESTFTPILLGVGLAHLLNSKRGYRIAEKVAGFSYAQFIFALALAAILNAPTQDISGFVRLAAHMLATIWIASLLLRPQHGLSRLLEHKLIVFIGAVSYGMYLYHMWALYAAAIIIAKLNLAPLWFTFPIGLGGTIVAAAISYYFFEKRFLNLRSKFRA